MSAENNKDLNKTDNLKDKNDKDGVKKHPENSNVDKDQNKDQDQNQSQDQNRNNVQNPKSGEEQEKNNGKALGHNTDQNENAVANNNLDNQGAIQKENKEEVYTPPKPKRHLVKIHADAYKTIILYATRYANKSIPRSQWKEIYGLLVGYQTDKEIIVEQAIPMTFGHSTDVELNAAHYGFIGEIEDKLYAENKGRFIVGWFHSHPGLSLFYSYVDVMNQTSFQQGNPDFIGIVFDHTYLLNRDQSPPYQMHPNPYDPDYYITDNHPNHPKNTGIVCYRLTDPWMTPDNPNFDNNYHDVNYTIIGLNQYFFANLLTEISAIVAQGAPLAKAYGEDITQNNIGSMEQASASNPIPQLANESDRAMEAEKLEAVNKSAILKQQDEIIQNAKTLMKGVKTIDLGGQQQGTPSNIYNINSQSNVSPGNTTTKTKTKITLKPISPSVSSKTATKNIQVGKPIKVNINAPKSAQPLNNVQNNPNIANLSTIPGVPNSPIYGDFSEKTMDEDSLESAEHFLYDGKKNYLIGNSFEAIEDYNKAIQIYEKFGKSEKILQTLSEIADICIKSNHDNLVLEYSDKLKQKAEEIGDLFFMGNADYYKAVILKKKDHLNDALKTFENSITLFEKDMDFAGAGRSNKEIGDIYLSQQEPDKAALFYTEAIKEYEKALKRFHPKRNEPWSLSGSLNREINELKNKIRSLMDKITNIQIKNRIINELRLRLD
ncbi:MAG: hypothetical protein ACTSXF_05005 [Promethearchaeota archaeon]